MRFLRRGKLSEDSKAGSPEGRESELSEAKEERVLRDSGDDGERVPPVPIPNTEVKPLSAEST